jgi:hypothetical protein
MTLARPSDRRIEQAGDTDAVGQLPSAGGTALGTMVSNGGQETVSQQRRHAGRGAGRHRERLPATSRMTSPLCTP